MRAILYIDLAYLLHHPCRLYFVYMTKKMKQNLGDFQIKCSFHRTKCVCFDFMFCVCVYNHIYVTYIQCITYFNINYLFLYIFFGVHTLLAVPVFQLISNSG